MMDERMGKIAKKLLAECDKIKGPAELEDWNMRARTLLVFAHMQMFCNKPIEELFEKMGA